MHDITEIIKVNDNNLTLYDSWISQGREMGVFMKQAGRFYTLSGTLKLGVYDGTIPAPINLLIQSNTLIDKALALYHPHDKHLDVQLVFNENGEISDIQEVKE